MTQLPGIDGIEPNLPGIYAVLALRDIVVFPHSIVPLFVGREKSMRAVKHALDTDRFLFLTAQKGIHIEDPSPDDLYSVGTVCLLLRTLRVKEGKRKILVQGLCKAKVSDFVRAEPFFMAEVEKKETEKAYSDEAETLHLIADVKNKLDKLVFEHGQAFPTDILVVIENLEEPEKLAHLIAGNMGLDVPRAQEILEINSSIQKLIFVVKILGERIRKLRNARGNGT